MFRAHERTRSVLVAFVRTPDLTSVSGLATIRRESTVGDDEKIRAAALLRAETDRM